MFQIKIKIFTINSAFELVTKIFKENIKNKINILKIDTCNYPIWKLDYAQNYKLC